MLFDRMFAFSLRKKSALAACTVSLESVSVSTGPNANKDSALEVVVSSQCHSLTIPPTIVQPPSPTKTKSKKSRHALLKCSPLMPLFASSKYNLKHKALERVKNGGTSPTAKTRKRASSSAEMVSAEQPRSPPPTIAVTTTPKRRRGSDDSSELGSKTSTPPAPDANSDDAASEQDFPPRKRLRRSDTPAPTAVPFPSTASHATPEDVPMHEDHGCPTDPSNQQAPEPSPSVSTRPHTRTRSFSVPNPYEPLPSHLRSQAMMYHTLLLLPQFHGSATAAPTSLSALSSLPTGAGAGTRTDTMLTHQSNNLLLRLYFLLLVRGARRRVLPLDYKVGFSSEDEEGGDVQGEEGVHGTMDVDSDEGIVGVGCMILLKRTGRIRTI
ncbi:hypothetical protein FA15DRAFT_111212 [Coprinopsis marcescibilis]|uniref:Uncharacterized protein n=1 Tax=Coprinopsis marcescibilis TaxID=230819 RepID=A0A5C3KKV2_COPMA|nr:hypothetical protein FA15DRAFT_111212 [Coprinopsis marcescibilis]